MYLKHLPAGDLVEVLDLPDVINPAIDTVRARAYTNDEVQFPDLFPKAELVFPSGEPLPKCWYSGKPANYKPRHKTHIVHIRQE